MGGHYRGDSRGTHDCSVVAIYSLFASWQEEGQGDLASSLTIRMTGVSTWLTGLIGTLFHYPI